MAENTQKISAALVLSERLVFYPKTTGEAAFIQEKLIALGGKWSTHGRQTAELQNCVDKGFLCEHGTFYYNPDMGKPFLRCTLEQLDEKYIPPEQAFLIEQFNKMAARIDALTAKVGALSDEVAALKAELYPDVADTKPALKKPGGKGLG